MPNRVIAPVGATTFPRRFASGAWSSGPPAELIQVVVVVGMGLVLRLPAMGRGLGQDELFSIVNFVDVPSVWTTISTNDAFNNHLGYSLMARVAEGLLGRAEWVFRVPALVYGLVSIPALWFLTRPLLPFPFPFLGALALALSPPAIAWSTSARGYSAMILFTLLSTVLYARLLCQPRRLDAWLFVIISIAGIYSHLYAAQVTLVQVLLRLRPTPTGGWRLPWGWRLPFKAVGPPMLISTFPLIALGSVLTYLPVARPMLRDIVFRGRGSFDPLFPAAVLAELSGLDWPPVIVLLLGVAALGWIAIRRSTPSVAWSIAALFLVPVALMVIARPIDLYPRFFAYFLPYLLLALVTGLHALWHSGTVNRPGLQVLLPRMLVGLAAVLVVAGWWTSLPRYVQDEGYREASRMALDGASPTATLCALGGARTVWQYYLGHNLATPQSLEEVQALARTSPEVRCVYYAASWQDAQQTEIADFFQAHAQVEHIQDLVVFIYRG